MLLPRNSLGSGKPPCRLTLTTRCRWVLLGSAPVAHIFSPVELFWSSSFSCLVAVSRAVILFLVGVPGTIIVRPDKLRGVAKGNFACRPDKLARPMIPVWPRPRRSSLRMAFYTGRLGSLL